MVRSLTPGKVGVLARLVRQTGISPADLEQAMRVAARARKEAKAREAARPIPSLHEWAEENRRIRGRPFSLDRFPPLRELYSEAGLHPDMVIIKAAQRGVSEWAINRALYTLDVGRFLWTGGDGQLPYDGLNAGYLFPTKTALYEFSKERFTPLSDESDHLRKLLGASGSYDALGFKQVGAASFLYLRGMQSVDDLRSFSADLLVYDEFDRHAPHMVSMSQSRLAESDLGHRVKLSTPSFPGMGIAAAYDESDGRRWHVPCSNGCGWFGEHDFFRDVQANGVPWSTWKTWKDTALKAADITVHCPNCGSPTEHWRDGAWVAQNPDQASIRGYYVPWYGVPYARLNDLAVSAVDPNPSVHEVFVNEGLGLPFASTGSRVTDAMLRAATADPADWPGGFGRTFLGIDVGQRFHCVVMSKLSQDDRLYAREAFTVSTWAEVTNVVRRYNPLQTVIDAAPELKATQDWARQFGPSKVLRAQLAENDQAFVKAWYDVQTERGQRTGVVRVSRTQMLDRVWGGFSDGKFVLAPGLVDTDDFGRHLAANQRTISQNEDTGTQKVVWTHTQDDHYAFAFGLAVLATECLPSVIYSPLIQGRAANRGF